MNRVFERPTRKTWKLVCRFKFFGREKVYEDVLCVAHSRLELTELARNTNRLSILASESVPYFERRPVEEVLILSSDIVLVE